MIDLKGSPFCLSDSDIEWVNGTLSGMTLKEKIGQLFCPLGLLSNRKSLLHLMKEVAIGGIMFRPTKGKHAQGTHRFLQNNSKIPLLIAGNLESGGNGAAADGTYFGMPMQIAATGNAEMGYHLGKISCAEGAATGINWAFAPIVDIDKNFRNPITNLRTFGSSPDTIISMARGYMRAADESGVAVAIKHFPGDGVDERDQHLLTSVNTLSQAEWDETYGKIYSELIAAGAKTVMVGHIALPSYQNLLEGVERKKTVPATLSKELMCGLLRERLRFNGLIVTDASPMAGFCVAMKREYAVPLAIENGADMFLFARDLATDYKYMVTGVEKGILSELRLNEAVTRILALKASLKLHVKAKENSLVPLPSALNILKSKQSLAITEKCADESVTLVKDTQKLLPISPALHRRVYLNVLENSDGIHSLLKSKLKQKLEAEGFAVTVRNRAAIADLGILVSPERTSIFKKVSVLFKARKSLSELVGSPNDFIAKYDLAIYVACFETASETTVVRLNWKGFKGIGNDIPWFVNDVPTIFISLANPYHLLDVPMIKTFINAYTNSEPVIDAVIDKILGRSEFKGISPVDASCGREDVLY
ncbi:MAG: glycoside hydrolase family 3 protein [Clostridiaceae bacterium]|jgi:beta-N-acetylhexosaminidase|nr:glycoside hydrolase family 3 protein [Clostridiaceae bacterium]